MDNKIFASYCSYFDEGSRMLPPGFEPGGYPLRNHPRGLQMTIYAASDTLGSLGIDWESIQKEYLQIR